MLLIKSKLSHCFPLSGLQRFARTLFSLPVPKTLDEVVKLPLFKQETRERMVQLWVDQWKTRPDVIGDVMDSAEFARLRANTTQSPHFVIPVPVPKTNERDTSTTTRYCNLYIQFQHGKSVQRSSTLGLLTTLDAIQQQRTASPPVATLYFYEDFKDERDIVFVRSDAICLLTKQQLTFCWDYVRGFYTDINLYNAWVNCFNHRSREFDFDTFMRQTSPLRAQLLAQSTSLL